MPADLARRLLARDRDAVPAALNLVDDGRAASRQRARALLDELQRQRAQLVASRVGITGAPGAGKSTLLDAIVRALRGAGRSVGILAIDPSSQRTGGALLGDRMRLSSAARDTGVFLRSLAARDRLGGLSEVTGPSLDVMVAAFDVVFVETVGVGQSEAEIIDLVDTLIFVAQPAAGDLIQFMKAGILEWPDIFFVNKSDLGDIARQTATELIAGLELGSRREEGVRPPVLCGSAREGLEIDALIEAIDTHQQYLKSSGQGVIRRNAGRVARVRSAISARYGSFGLGRLTGSLSIERYVSEKSDLSVERLVSDLGSDIERGLDSGGH